jgi:hypothetical protein
VTGFGSTAWVLRHYDWLKKPVPCPALLHRFALYGGFAARRVRLCDLSPQGFGHILGHIGGMRMSATGRDERTRSPALWGRPRGARSRRCSNEALARERPHRADASNSRGPYRGRDEQLGAVLWWLHKPARTDLRRRWTRRSSARSPTSGASSAEATLYLRLRWQVRSPPPRRHAPGAPEARRRPEGRAEPRAHDVPLPWRPPFGRGEAAPVAAAGFGVRVRGRGDGRRRGVRVLRQVLPGEDPRLDALLSA